MGSLVRNFDPNFENIVFVNFIPSHLPVARDSVGIFQTSFATGSLSVAPVSSVSSTFWDFRAYQ